MPSGDACAGGDAQCGAVRTGDIGEGAVIYVEEAGIGALEQNGLALVHRFVERVDGVDDVRFQPLAHLEQRPGQGGRIERWRVQSQCIQFACSNGADDLKLGSQMIGIQQVAHSYGQ